MAKNINDHRILIVDDTLENVEILGSILTDYKRSVALNGEKALEITSGKNRPDLILLDVMMPGMDGFEVCRRLKENPDTRDIPVIFITAKTEVEDETRGLELGAVDFIPKPISPPVVIARVKNQLELLLAREILQSQNEELEYRNKYITDSIQYAKRIQTAILPDENFIRECFPESFLIYHPKDIVSGDFYWLSELDDKCLIAAVDCTGHGVPGAFMSMIGNTLLNKIVNEKGVHDPAEILNLLDRGVIEELQKEHSGASLDGMDIGMCLIDRTKKIIKFSGAYRMLYYFQDGKPGEIKGDKKSIGEKKKDQKFTGKEIPLVEKSTIYLTTDGFVDQHNGEGKKFGSKKLRELLQEIQKEKLPRQKEILEEESLKHRGEQVQRDDITIIGIKL